MREVREGVAERQGLGATPCRSCRPWRSEGIAGTPPPNNGMHPTPLQRAFHESCAGARVMPGVRTGWRRRVANMKVSHRRPEPV